jgi:WD40 repeat protein
MFGACWDKTIKVWDFESNELEFLLKGHEDLVVHVAIIPRTSKIISASYDHSVKVWDYKERRLVASLDDHLDKVNEVAVNANGTRAISASHDHSGIVWDLRTYKKIATFSGDSTFRSCDISQDGNQFVLGSTLGRLHLLELRNYE